jgi:hypothetical protein
MGIFSSQFCNFKPPNYLVYSNIFLLYNMVQYMERVSVVVGKKPMIFVAPHGAHCDDINTALIAEELAKATNGYAVINRGWERSKYIDHKNDKANCNNIEHCHQDVIKEEFLDPLIRFKCKILKKWSRVFIVYLHGMRDNVQEETGIDKLNYVLGWGNGEPNSRTCQKWIKKFIAYELSINDNCVVGEGIADGKYAGWTRNNMVQLFRKWYPDEEVDSIQIEIINKIRSSILLALTTTQILAITMNNLVNQESSWETPNHFRVPMV